MLPPCPSARLRVRNDAPLRPERRYVLYWMIAARRTQWSFGLQHALARAQELEKPLLVLEALRAGYPWASDRLHAFVVDGMADNAAALRAAGVRYYPYLEPEPGAGRGLLEALASEAALVVTDHFPCFFLPRMVAAAAHALDVRLEAVDGNGLLPLALAEKAYPTAYAFRRFLQKSLPEHLAAFPLADPLRAARRSIQGGRRGRSGQASVPRRVLERWPSVPESELASGARARIASLPIDHGVPPVAYRGGAAEAARVGTRFLAERLGRYADERNQPEEEIASGLSPYLHFGHASAHRVVAELLERESWSPDRLSDATDGKREGWWGTSPAAEAFLDELVAWRELGYVLCERRPDDYDAYESLPAWARSTLEQHAGDPREHTYTLAELEAGRTHDPLWNAAQEELRREGRIHNYLRMLWGKKVLEWSPSPREALARLIHLNNKYALDGRDPNSYSGIFWCLGRFDRPWGPKRPAFGTVRYMSSASTRRKLELDDYLERFGSSGPAQRELFEGAPGAVRRRRTRRRAAPDGPADAGGI